MQNENPLYSFEAIGRADVRYPYLGGASGRYTMVCAGRARGNQDRLAAIEEATQPTPEAGIIVLPSMGATHGSAPCA